MKIALLTEHLSVQAGGFAVAVPGMARSLSTYLGEEVAIVGIADNRHPEGWRDWGNGNVYVCETIGPRSFGFSLEMMHKIKEIDPNIVDTQGLWIFTAVASLYWYRRYRRPFVVTPHGMLHPWSLRRSRWKKRLASLAFGDEHLRSAACLRATANSEAGHFRALGLKNPVAVVPIGIDLPTFVRRTEVYGRRRRLLFLSRLHPVKGVPYLLRAWARLSGLYPDWELVIAGPDEIGYREQMQDLAAQIGAGNVVWHEAVRGEAKSALYRSADLFVLPTHSENFGLVVAEALAHGVPVVTTRNAPWGGLERHRCGWWIDLSDDSLVNALDEGMSLSNSDRVAMGAHGRAWMVDDFSWRAVGHQMQEVYTWVLGGGPPPACVLTD